MKPIVNLYKLGRLPYVRALNAQQILFDELKKNVTLLDYNGDGSKANLVKPIDYGFDRSKFSNRYHYTNNNSLPDGRRRRNSLILVEHEPVYTVGIRSKQYNNDYISQLKSELEERKLRADFVETNRGGLITFHGPGQLVAYPIFYLGDFTKTIKNRSIKAYVNVLEATIIDTLAKVGLKGAHTVQEYPGVWIDGGERKIAFIGVSCKRFVTMHGISINCNCDLSWFDHIVSCGIEDKLITSVRQELLAANEIRTINDGVARYRHDSLTIDVNDDYDGRLKLNKSPDYLPQTEDGRVFESVCSNGQREAFDVEHISRAFCLSFEQHFDCILRTEAVHEFH